MVKSSTHYTSDNLVIAKDPDTQVIEWGIYRSMFRTINEKNFDMTCTSHRGRLNGLKYQAKGENMPVGDCPGRTYARQAGNSGRCPSDTPDYEVLGSFYRHPAQPVKCETNDLLGPLRLPIQARVVESTIRGNFLPLLSLLI